MHRFPVNSCGQSGFSLIEILVSMLILSIGLLGVAAMQYTGLKDSNRANERSIATILAYDIADRMRTNASGAFDGDYTASPPGSVPSNQCNGDSCTSDELARADLFAWHALLNSMLVSGTGSVSCTDADGSDALSCSPGSVHTIRVMWDERRSGATGTGCDNSDPDELFCLSVDVQI